MRHYLIIETRSALLDRRLSGVALALEAAESGAEVSLWLMQDGTQVLQTAGNATFEACCRHERIKVFADDFALAQRGISLAAWPEVAAAGIDAFAARLLADGTRPIWH